MKTGEFLTWVLTKKSWYWSHEIFTWDLTWNFLVGKRECSIFGPGMTKNSIRSTGVKLDSPHLVFATLFFGSGVNLDDLWKAYFSSYPDRKYHICVFEPGAKVVLSARVWRKSTSFPIHLSWKRAFFMHVSKKAIF